MTKASATFERDEEGRREPKPIPRKAKRTAMIFSVLLMAVACLPSILEISSVFVNIGPWLTLPIAIPMMLVAFMFMAFLRDDLTANLISTAAIVFAMFVSYGTTFSPEEFDSYRSLAVRSAGPAVCAAVLVFFWLGLRTKLRDLHYLIDQGESMQDIMLRYKQASVIQKAGGKPALTEDGKVVDATEITGRPGFRQKPQKSAAQKGEKKKRKKPKVR
ncbi:MAG: hypothetical protein KF696_14895 [Planctomycetes bacterium]|nr:hypothetical protein [Planctomycetota bacterium]MCW8135854.1 hypothetical protein [Planctomycetota bacterium]